LAVGQRFLGDKGYVGEDQIEAPHKKPKKQELTADDKEENKKLSKQRIVVEHMIRLLKAFRVAAQRFRLSYSRYEQVILTICGLARLRVGALILPQLKPEDSGV
jgi:transposase